MSDFQEFESQVLSYLDSLYSVAQHLSKDQNSAEDLVQDTVLKAIQAKEQFEVGTNMKAWLIKILTNTFINRYRRSGRERELLDTSSGRTHPESFFTPSDLNLLIDPEREAMNSNLRKELVHALEKIPEDYRVAVILSDVEDLSYKEIADVQGCQMGTVMSRLHRGRKMLKEILIENDVEKNRNHIVEQKTKQVPIDFTAYRERKQGNL